MFREKFLKTVLVMIALLLSSGVAFAQNPFISTWRTVMTNDTVIVPTTTASDVYTVDWGDGNVEDFDGVSATHIYAMAGDHQVKISGSFERIYFNNGGSKDKIISIDQWGDADWISMNSAFYGCSMLEILATDTPNLNQVRSMENMFRDATSVNQSISGWEISNVSNLKGMFYGATSFNQPLDSWDVSNVTNMSNMFRDATLFNQSLAGWITSNMSNMSGIFYGATSFNQPLDSWDVSNVTSMSNMFRDAILFNQSLSGWITSNVLNMGNMFYGATLFNQPLDIWDVSNVTNMTNMFRGASSFNQPLNNWEIMSVTRMRLMFRDAILFNQPLDNWDTENVIDMSSMFRGASLFNQTLNSWDVSNVELFNSMFRDAVSFNQSLNDWKTGSATSMNSMFRDATSFNQPLGNWDTENATDLSGMFRNANSFDQPLDTWETDSVINMSNMFRNASSFNQVIGSWNTGKVINMTEMFRDADSFDQDLGSWDISSVTSMLRMFNGVVFSKLTGQPSNYDNILIGWGSQTLQQNIPLGVGNNVYCYGQTAWYTMTTTYGWTISDGGLDCPLPVQLTYFGTEKLKYSIRLTWVTATELNNNKFLLFKSVDAKNWKKIIEIAGNGTSKEEIEYMFEDKNPILGDQYYKLVQKDFDGIQENLGVVRVKWDKSEDNVRIYPNPFSNAIYLTNNIVNKNDFQIFDVSGMEVTQQTSLDDEKTINTVSLLPGIYFLKIRSQNFLIKKIR